MKPAERITLDAYVVDALLPDLVGHDRRASAFAVYLFLWRRTRGGARTVVVSHAMVSEGTGLSRRSAQAALAWLERRALVQLRRATTTSATSVTLRCPWR